MDRALCHEQDARRRKPVPSKQLELACPSVPDTESQPERMKFAASTSRPAICAGDQVSRRAAIGLILAGLASRSIRAAPGSTDYEKDVDFLLTELERKAGHFFAVKQIDWKSVAGQFRDEVKSTKDDVAHVKMCNRLVTRLRDGHAALLDVKVKMPDPGGGRRFTGPRVHLVIIGDRVFVRQAFGSAQQAGIEIGAEVIAIDDTAIQAWLKKTVARLQDERGYSTDHTALYYACHTGLADWEGTRIKFDLINAGPPKTIELVRSGGPNFVPIGPVFPPKELATVGRQSCGRTAAGFGYVHLRDVPGTLPEQIDEMLSKVGDVRSLVLDTRANGGGGCDHEAVFGRFVPAGQKWRQYASAGAHPFGGPMVVIVDAGVRSAGETVAGMFKEDGRAFMIGDTPTAGTSSQKEKLSVPSGLFTVYFSVASNKGRFNGGRGIEGIGVPPHEVTPYDPMDLARGIDTQIRRAEELLTKGLPGNKVPWAA